MNSMPAASCWPSAWRRCPAIEPVVVTGGWPKDESVFDGARTLVFFMDGGGNTR